MSIYQPRRPAGVPTGGQFASKTRPEPGYTLDAEDDSPHGERTENYLCRECGMEVTVDEQSGVSSHLDADGNIDYDSDIDHVAIPDYDDDDPGPATIDGQPVEPEIEVRGDGIRVKSYYRNDRLHDPDDGRPAVVSHYLDATGTVESEQHYRDGQLHDPDDGRPASVYYRQDGTVESEQHYRDGQLHDPDDGRPAFVIYDPDGTVVREWHYRDGRLQDPDDGCPMSVVAVPPPS